MVLIREILLVTASYLGVFVLTVVAINWLLGGLFKPYLKVRGSRGKLVLIKVKNIVSDYFVAGKIEERVLIFKDRNKNVRRVPLIKDVNPLYRSMAVTCIDIDDEKNCFILYSGAGITGFDAVKYNDLYLRALYKPALVDKKELIILLLCALILIFCIVNVAMTFQNGKLIKALGEITKPVVVSGVQSVV